MNKTDIRTDVLDREDEIKSDAWINLYFFKHSSVVMLDFNDDIFLSEGAARRYADTVIGNMPSNTPLITPDGEKFKRRDFSHHIQMPVKS